MWRGRSLGRLTGPPHRQPILSLYVLRMEVEGRVRGYYTHGGIPILKPPRSPQRNSPHDRRRSKETHNRAYIRVDIFFQIRLPILQSPAARLDAWVEREESWHDRRAEFVQQECRDQAEELRGDIVPGVVEEGEEGWGIVEAWDEGVVAR